MYKICGILKNVFSTQAGTDGSGKTFAAGGKMQIDHVKFNKNGEKVFVLSDVKCSVPQIESFMAEIGNEVELPVNISFFKGQMFHTMAPV